MQLTAMKTPNIDIITVNGKTNDMLSLGKWSVGTPTQSLPFPPPSKPSTLAVEIVHKSTTWNMLESLVWTTALE